MKIKLVSIIISLLITKSLLFANNDQAIKKALLMSAVLPGSGQLYLGQNTKAGLFITSDILLFATLYRSNIEKNVSIHQYQQFGQTKAGIAKNANQEIYNLAQKYQSAIEYNSSLEIYASHFYRLYWYFGFESYTEGYDYYEYYMEKYSQPEDAWNWDNHKDYAKYMKLRNNKIRFESYESIMIGTIVLNRIISVLDVFIFNNKINKENRQLYTTPQKDFQGITLNYEIQF